MDATFNQNSDHVTHPKKKLVYLETRVDPLIHTHLPIHLWLLPDLKVFDDIIVILNYALRQLGFTNITQSVHPNYFALNICLGAAADPHRVVHAQLSQLIIVNYEQLYDASEFMNQSYCHLLSIYPVWDYSKINIAWLKQKLNIDAQRLTLNYAPALEQLQSSSMLLPTSSSSLSRVLPFSFSSSTSSPSSLLLTSSSSLLSNLQPPHQDHVLVKKDIDILFIGVIDGHRLQLLNQLRTHYPSYRVHFVCGVWGAQRLDLIHRSKIVLNLHRHPTALFEWVRVSFLLTQRAFVISESSTDDADYKPWLKEGMVFTDTNSMMDTIVKYLEMDANERQYIAQKGYEIVSKEIPHAEIPDLILRGNIDLKHTMSLATFGIDFYSYLMMNSDILQHCRNKMQLHQHALSTLSSKIDFMHQEAQNHYKEYGYKESHRAYRQYASTNGSLTCNSLRTALITSDMILEQLKQVIHMNVPQCHRLYLTHFYYPQIGQIQYANHEERPSLVLCGVFGQAHLCRLVIQDQWVQTFEKHSDHLFETLQKLNIKQVVSDDVMLESWIYPHTLDLQQQQKDDQDDQVLPSPTLLSILKSNHHDCNLQALVIAQWFK